ncbi:THO2 plays a role in transcriptional elongation, partial [Coemansia biformis]
MPVQAFLASADSGAGICSQLLRAACAASDGCGVLDAEEFGRNASGWVECCIETVENTEGAAAMYGSSNAIRARISAALVESIWALGIEWEPEASGDDSQRWSEEQLQHMEQTKSLASATKGLIGSGVVDSDIAKERLDAHFLEQIGAIPSATVFTRKYIRLNTALHFKQTKFNLVSEQNEGFAKLVVLIQGTMAAVGPHQIRSGLLQLAASSVVAEGRGTAVVQALRALRDLQEPVQLLLVDIRRLIGVFNIDPNRALDAILDCFMSSVRFYWPFYIALLDASPWCQDTSGSPKLAQLVGWKLQFYASETVPASRFVDELLTVAALLIAHGLVRLADVYPMLTPARNEDASKEFAEWCAAQKERHPQGAGNRLAEMGSLEDTGDSGEHTEAVEAKGAVPGSTPPNQHAELCAKLLSLGDTESALVYLKRFPNLARVHPEIADLAVRIVDVATSDIYRSADCVRAPLRPYLRLRSPVSATALNSDQPAAGPWGLPGRQQQQPQQQLHHPPEAYPTTKHYVLSPLVKEPNEEFFYEDFWLLEAARRLPRPASIDSLPRVLAPWMNVAFLRLHRSSSLLTRLIRLCRYGLQRQPDKHVVWIGFLRAWILPAYSLSKPSPGLSNELWILVSMLPQPTRYALYSDWNAMLTSSQPMLPWVTSCEPADPGGERTGALDMAMSLDAMLDDDGGDDDGSGAGGQTAFVELEALSHDARRQVRSTMRRLSGDTVKVIGRQLCSLCHPTPTLSLKIVLDQVCSYDNLVDSVVEAFRYLTPLDADVLFCLILTTLDDPAGAKVKDDGVNTAHWLQSLALFVAVFSHRHENPALGVVLKHVLRQIVSMVHAEDAPPVFETAILSETIGRLAAIDVMANATEDQILALQGGYHLGLEAFSMVSQWVLPQDATVDAVLAASSGSRLTRRLAHWLTNLLADGDQALPFAVAMCIHADKVLKMTALPLSNMLVIYDREIERVHQLFHLLHTNLKPDRYARLIPGPHVLASEYGVDWGLAILWGRPIISRRLAQGLKQWESEGEAIVVKVAGRGSVEGGAKDGDAMQTDAAQPDRSSGANGSADTGTAAAESAEHAAPATLGDDSKMDVDVSTGVDADTDTGAGATDDADASAAASACAGAAGDRPVGSDDNGCGETPRIVSDLYFEAPLLPRDYVEHIARTLPPSVSDIGLSSEFVATFWALSLYDIEVPVDRYAKDIEVQSSFIARVDALAKQAHGSRSKAAMLAQARTRACAAVESLEKEMAEQREHVQRIRRWLIAQKDYWFCMAHEQRKLVAQALLQHCILPRAVLSASDAGFCAKFLWMMHFPLATNKFSLMIVYDNVFGESLSTLLAVLTENEARNYAKFLNTSLAYLAPLHLSETNYKDRAVNPWRGLTGFQQQWHYERGYLPPKSRTIRQKMPSKPSADSGDARRIKPGSAMLSYDDFRTVMRKWQVNLTKAFICILESERNDTVRNGILALREMQKSFPVILQYGRRILDKVNEVAASGRSANTREGSAGGAEDEDKNLKVMAASYSAYLGMAKKSWIPEANYYSVPTKGTSRRT